MSIEVTPRHGERETKLPERGMIGAGLWGDDLATELSEGPMPFCEPNGEYGKHLVSYINKDVSHGPKFVKKLGVGLTAISVVGIPYLAAKTFLIEKGKMGYSLHNGVPCLLQAGWHCLLSATHRLVRIIDLKQKFINIDPMTIVTIEEGQYGFAFDNGKPQVLLPGRHIRNSAVFEYIKSVKLTDKIIEFGPLSIITVETGEVGIGNSHGSLMRMEEGFRYEINSAVFKFERHLRIKQRLKHFKEIKIATQDGVQMSASGLLTYQLSDVNKLIAQVEIKELEPHIERITKGALVNMFTRFPLKQIMQAIDIEEATAGGDEQKSDEPLLKQNDKIKEAEGASVRNKICEEVASEVQDMASPWGVSILRFQLQTLLFFDQTFARDYENATLHLATTEVDARSADITNRIKIKNAKADGEAREIQAEAQKVTVIKLAEGEAEAIEITAIARNKAAETMTNPLAEQLALLSVRKDIVKASKLQSLTMLSDSDQAKVMIPGFDHHRDFLSQPAGQRR